MDSERFWVVTEVFRRLWPCAFDAEPLTIETLRLFTTENAEMVDKSVACNSHPGLEQWPIGWVFRDNININLGLWFA